jgi:uncharacterized membrane protein YbhN (UPF0104 family)
MLRIAALVVVCIGVSGTVRHALAQLAQHEWELRPGWLVVSGAVFVLGLFPMAWFWYRVLAALRYPAPLSVAMRAYFLSQLGKYVPGKAMVIILRVAAVRRWAPSMRMGIISVFVETLTMMAVGGFLAFLLSAFVLKSDAYIWLIALGMALASGVPTLPLVVRWFSQLGVGLAKQTSEPPATDAAESEWQLRGVTFGLLAEGWFAATISWVLFAISLWATMRAIGVEQTGLIADMPVLITAVAFSVVAGFLSMLPGGLVVRDAILMQLLAPVCGEANALVAAILVRLVWLVSEVVACGILYIGRGNRGQRSADKNPSDH